MSAPHPRVPIVLGVVGHRDVRPQDRDALRDSLRALFAEFRAAWPHAPLVVVTPLAEGADLLAAEVALEASGGAPGEVVVRAPLPMPPDAYRASTSFRSDEGRDALDRVLEDPRTESFVVPLPVPSTPADAAAWRAIATGQAPRERHARHACYANAGVYVARHCHVLVALWDGVAADASREAGTAEIVRFMLEGRAPASYPWRDAEPLGFAADRGPVVVLHAPRGEDTGVAAGTRTLRLPDEDAAAHPRPGPLAERVRPLARCVRRALSSMGLGHGDERQQLRETCQAVDDFDRDALRRDRRLDARLARPETVPGPAAPWLRRIEGVRATAGHLAERLRRRLERALDALFALLLAAVVTFHLYAHAFDVVDGAVVHRPLYLGLFLVALVGAAALVVAVWWHRLDARRHDYRALAEALRVRHAWARAGLETSVADGYLGQLRGEMAWARRALLHVSPPPRLWKEAFDALGSAGQLARLREVGSEWVAVQRGFFEKRRKSHHLRASFLRTAGFLLAVAGWVLAVWILLAGASHPDPSVLIASGVAAVCGGVLIAICDRRSHEDLAKQYERLRLLFEHGAVELEERLRTDDVPGAQKVLEALGREAVAEHAQWLVLRRARGFELHIG